MTPPRPTSPREERSEHWTATQVIEAVAMLRRVLESPVVPEFEREAMLRWLDENHPRPETYIEAMKEVSRRA